MLREDANGSGKASGRNAVGNRRRSWPNAGVTSADGNAPCVKEVNPREVLLELVQKTYTNWLLDRDRRAKEFHDLWKVVGTVPVRRVFAHEDARKIGDMCALILADAARVLGSVRL